MSHEHTSTPEQYPWREINLSWPELLVALLERKVIPAYPTHRAPYGGHGVYDHRWHERRFTTTDGIDMRVAGKVHRDGSGEIFASYWAVEVGPAAPDGQSLRYRYNIVGRSNTRDSYQAFHEGSDTPLDPEAVEGLLGIVASAVPVKGEAEGSSAQPPALPASWTSG